MNRRLATFQPTIPAAISRVRVGHARKQGARLVSLHPHPSRVTEGVRAFEIAGVGKARRIFAADGIGFLHHRTRLPIRIHAQREHLVGIGELNFGFRALALSQRRMKNQMIRRNLLGLIVKTGCASQFVKAVRANSFRAASLFLSRRNGVHQLLPARIIHRLGHDHDRRRVLDISIHRLLRRIVKKSGQRIKIFL